jgi:hypothetical protein
MQSQEGKKATELADLNSESMTLLAPPLYSATLPYLPLLLVLSASPPHHPSSLWCPLGNTIPRPYGDIYPTNKYHTFLLEGYCNTYLPIHRLPRHTHRKYLTHPHIHYLMYTFPLLPRPAQVASLSVPPQPARLPPPLPSLVCMVSLSGSPHDIHPMRSPLYHRRHHVFPHPATHDPPVPRTL